MSETVVELNRLENNLTSETSHSNQTESNRNHNIRRQNQFARPNSSRNFNNNNNNNRVNRNFNHNNNFNNNNDDYYYNQNNYYQNPQNNFQNQNYYYEDNYQNFQTNLNNNNNSNNNYYFNNQSNNNRNFNNRYRNERNYQKNQRSQNQRVNSANNYTNNQAVNKDNNLQTKENKASSENNSNSNTNNISNDKTNNNKNNKNKSRQKNDYNKSEQFNPKTDAKQNNKNKQLELKNLKQNQTRSEILIEQLKKNKCECMVCFAFIRHDKPIWNCNVCFHIFHLSCIKKWANSPSAKIEETSDKWRCPGCQNVLDSVPNKYTCFCTKKLNPEPENRPHFQLKQLPHSCGEVCSKPLISSSKFWSQNSTQHQNEPNIQSIECKHKCLDICHPGPCSPCESLVTRSCNCGKAKFQVKCSSSKIPACEKKCDKLLNCKLHVCERVCHSGDCEPCNVDVELICNSHGDKKLVKCGSDDFNLSKNTNFYFNCQKECGKLLSCKNHKCLENCHQGDCKPCPLLPSQLTKCPCNQTSIRELLIKQKLIRTTCIDPVPTCEKICSKVLPCNSKLENENEIHTCEAKCHLNECPPCEKLVEVKCRCGRETEMLKCFNQKQLKLCTRRCQKKKTCSRHQCNELCCDDKEHICMQICNKPLSCGLHKCEELCHKSSCKRCLVASFDERICECGSTIQYPPIRCGTKPLECSKPCSRVHNCNHPVSHNCHWEEKCPPCSYLTSKMCMGEHEIRHNIPCYMKDVSCGKQCGKQLPNCAHKCIKTCHRDICVDTDEKCTQLCQKERPHCNHACNSPCHGDSPCPDTICQELILAKCRCGLKSKKIKCQQKMYGESAVVFENLACQLKEMLSCKSIDVSSFKNQEILKKKHELDCDEECFLIERNRNITQALQIEASSRPKPIYSDFLKNFAREDPSFAMGIEYKFEALINESKLYKTKKSINLPIMKSFERRFIHELATYYGIETFSQDPEPYRNVTLYASKDKCYLPSVTLSQSIDLKSKQQVMPRLAIKQLNKSISNPISSNLKILQAENDSIPISSAFSALNDEQENVDQLRNESENNEKVIDYFDLTE